MTQLGAHTLCCKLSLQRGVEELREIISFEGIMQRCLLQSR